jgi:hypothetical protein
MASPRLAGGGPVIDLRVGCARWLRRGHAGVSLLGLAGILGSGARPAWTAAAVVALALVHFATARSMRGPGSHGRLRLFADGTAIFVTGGREVNALQRDGGWSSRWFSAVPLGRLDDGRRMTAIVCRSLNAPDDYRRLLIRLRLREQLAPSRGLGGP